MSGCNIVSIMVVMFITGEFRLMVVMREDILHCKFVLLHEPVLIQRAEEFILLHIWVTGIWFFRINSGKVLSLKHVLQFKAEEPEEPWHIEIGEGRLVVVVVFENP